LKIRLAEANGRWGKWELNFPLRFVFSSDFSYIDYQGLTFSPGIQGSYNQIFCNLCGLFFRVSFRFGSELYNDYFYQVDKIYATPTRAEFDADSGYLGSQLFLGYSLSIGKIQAFTGASFYNLSGSQIAKSPLVKQHTNTTLIFGIGWLFWQSEEKEYK
jgi:hypothetical protein